MNKLPRFNRQSALLVLNGVVLFKYSELLDILWYNYIDEFIGREVAL